MRLKYLEKSNDGFEYKVHWGIDLQSEHERHLTETVFKKPVIVFDYPKGNQGVLHEGKRRRENRARPWTF